MSADVREIVLEAIYHIQKTRAEALHLEVVEPSCDRLSLCMYTCGTRIVQTGILETRTCSLTSVFQVVILVQPFPPFPVVL